MDDSTDDHRAAVEAFVRRVEAADDLPVERLVLFGSVARGAHGRESDVDILAVVDDADEGTTAERLRDIAYDTMLEYGTAISVQTTSTSTLDRRRTHPFFRRVLGEGHQVYG